MGFPSGSDSKEAAYKAGDPGWIPWVGKSPWRREWQLCPVFLPGKFRQRGLTGYHPWCCKESNVTEQLTYPVPKDTDTARHTIAIHDSIPP